jgi:hypothetical protein
VLSWSKLVCFPFWGTVERISGPPIHKACLVAQGVSQIPFVNYNATFMPITKSASVRFVAIHAALHGWHLECFDAT